MPTKIIMAFEKMGIGTSVLECNITTEIPGGTETITLVMSIVRMNWATVTILGEQSTTMKRRCCRRILFLNVFVSCPHRYTRTEEEIKF